MFFRKAPNDPAAQEAQRLAIERAKALVNEELEKMRDATPSEAERLHERIKERCNDKTLPLPFKQTSLMKARMLECNANMRATDDILREAMRMAAGEDMKERGRKLSEGRKFFAKACQLGAGPEFRRAAERLIETIMLTGGVHRSGPSRAKPLDTAPRAPNRAKV